MLYLKAIQQACSITQRCADNGASPVTAYCKVKCKSETAVTDSQIMSLEIIDMCQVDMADAQQGLCIQLEWHMHDWTGLAFMSFCY